MNGDQGTNVTNESTERQEVVLEFPLQDVINAMITEHSGGRGLSGLFEKLSEMFRDRYDLTHDLSDLDAARQYAEPSARDRPIPINHLDFTGFQEHLAGLYTDRYYMLGNIDDLEAALKYGREAVEGTPSGHQDLLRRQQNLTVSYQDRYRRLGNMEDLEAALGYGQKVIENTPPEHPNLPGRQQGLSMSYIDRYRRLGSIEDLETALKYSQIVVDNTPLGHPHLPGRQQNLAVPYTERYKRLGSIDDLETALKLNQMVLDATPLGHPDLPDRQQNLGGSFTDRYRRLGNTDDMEAAIRYNQMAIDITVPGDPELPDRQENLALSFIDRYRRLGKIDDLEGAIRYYQMAVDNMPQNHPDLPSKQKYLAESLIERYTRLGNTEDLNAALEYSQMAVNTTPLGHPNLPNIQQNLAISYTAKYKRTGDTENLKTASALYHDAVHSSTALPSILWNIAVEWASFSIMYNMPHTLEAYICALNILPDLLWPGNSVNIKHNALVTYNISATISDATTYSLSLQLTEKAIEFLEQGLATTYKQALELKQENRHLYKILPQQALQLQNVSQLLRGAIIDNFQTKPSINYHLLAQQRKNVIADIRSNPDFKDFLKPLSYSKLSSAAQHGPVIMLYCTPSQTHVMMILSPSLPPKYMTLPNVSYKNVQEYLQKLQNALHSLSIHSSYSRYGKLYQGKASSSHENLQFVTSWLWTSIVSPIFKFLSQNGICSGRLWWCPSGLFNYLPLHAAAPLESKFIQSYTPTLQALIQANNKNVPSNDNFLTAIGITNTSRHEEHWTKLPFVSKEITAVSSIFGAQSLQINDSEATIDNVTQKLQSSTWLHFACHAHQDPTDSLKSGLILYDGNLELGQILDMDLTSAKFIYLSACETAMGDAKLTNEAMHLTGGFIAAGFQGAIGTLWSILDSDGPKVAEIVYQTIFQNNNAPDVSLAAEGLHLAVQKLRKEGAPLHQWMPFIHVGI